jgi:competence protein ComEA
MKQSISKLARRISALAALALLVAAMGGTWTRSASAAPPPAGPVTRPAASSSPPPASSSSPSSATHAGDEPDEPAARKSSRKQVAGKLNLNTASEEQLLLLPTVGPAKAERILAWRTKNGGFKRIADLRRVKGFGYKTLKKLEPYLDIKGETTLAAR